jgi:rubrerythrin
MKVLKQGGEGWSQEFVCQGCASTLLVETSDLAVINTAMGYAGETWEPEVAFNCPVCQTTNQVSSRVPDGIRNRLISEANRKRKSH